MEGKIIIKCHYCRKNDSAGVVKEETGDEVLLHVLTSVGDQPFVNQSQRFSGGAGSSSQAHLGEVAIELAPSQERNLTSAEVAAR